MPSIEPPPELPLHSFSHIEPPRPRRRIVNRLKDLLTPNTEQRHRQDSEYEQMVLRPPAFPLVEDSTKTFLTSNNADMQEPQPQEPQPRLQSEAQQTQFQPQRPPPLEYINNDSTNPIAGAGAPASFFNIPRSVILGDPNAFSNFSSSLHIKHVGLRSVVKRLTTVAHRKSESARASQKFLRDLVAWGQNSSFDNVDSLELVSEIQNLFQQDSIIEQRISERLKALAAELDYVCIREQELSQERKNLALSLRKHRHALEKKGEGNEEVTLLREKVIAHERAFESYKSHYQYAVSVTARQAFEELGMDFYENSSDLKETSAAFLKKTLQTLQIVDGDGFVKDLEKIRLVRAERNWSKLSPQQRGDPQSWVDLVSGKLDGDDTLMQRVYQGLPRSYSVMEPPLDFRTGLEESMSAIDTGRFNPITSNEFFSPRDQNPSKYQPLDHAPAETQKHEDVSDVVRSLNPNVVGRLDTQPPSVLSVRESNEGNILQDAAPPRKQSKSSRAEDPKFDGFIVNFGNISQQFDDAERHLQENRWLD
ncbi:SSP1 (YHR184W) [Zygosaccharomyces parabailii]|uniref:ZYBA0S07-01838g1_1 n=1 Tax=Zygosaccharomyces bailii (strain CLIB 213 / ATCC 58445 / CBS 680 / BCRC 21525 / NBRC 1098 / NCYC 1416 / NRRL Y-2227) TaxID=1333698 RepID=A0A8J2T951_ZYGB2|nr:SSP1 (YHR184W) [Zygosaccharomyces parabailii]CDF90473.1 ZYBA0S07-01838g1_1 [Zygosaccharomyces bailii CLIB 213]CDH15159.1 uncharacterized protein ZBAI_06946 [Zygosaccharomyces bailii ISA1307]